jgi:carboxylesterase type B
MKPKSDYIPVLVQIHGGGYDQGNSQSNPGYMMVNQSMGNLIYVSIQYRLAAFGFLSSNEIRENGAANAGLLDQRAALGWVQRNIRAFGGDPSKVTIIGGSAGGGSVMDQLILYGGASNPPFRAAISEYPWWQSYKNNTILEAQYGQMLTATSCDNLACLRSQSTQSLIDAMQASLISYGWEKYYGWGDFYYGPAVDGDVIRDLPSNEFKQGHFSKVPLIVNRDVRISYTEVTIDAEGFQQYEGYNYSPMDDNTEANMTRELQTIFPYAKPSFFKRMYQLYPESDFNSTFFKRAQIYGDYIIDCRK